MAQETRSAVHRFDASTVEPDTAYGWLQDAYVGYRRHRSHGDPAWFAFAFAVRKLSRRRPHPAYSAAGREQRVWPFSPFRAAGIVAITPPGASTAVGNRSVARGLGVAPAAGRGSATTAVGLR